MPESVRDESNKYWNYEAICKECRVTPAEKVRYRGRVILIADSNVELPGSSFFAQPHYRTVYAIGRDEEHLDVSRSLAIERGPMENSVKNARVAAAKQEAFKYIDDINVSKELFDG